MPGPTACAVQLTGIVAPVYVPATGDVRVATGWSRSSAVVETPTSQRSALSRTCARIVLFVPAERVAEMAALVNERMENIGARRLYTMMERVLEELSFYAPEIAGQKVDGYKKKVKGIKHK